MFQKIKNKLKNFMTNKAAFSLVELIVVIAIMAVMAAVLAPALLGYVERSRAQKDTSAMSEMVNSVQLSLADQDVYDEMLKYSAEQYSCYVDSDSPDEANKVDIKAGKYFMYNDNERQLDETVYRLDGVMRGVTITFAPDAAASNNATLDLIKGHVNKYLPSGKKTYGGLTGVNASPQLSAIADSELYNSLRATIGDKISISSQTYRNSEYTIFIAMGTTGGNQADMQDAIKVWGQWSGTNLPEGTSVASNGSDLGTNADSNEFQDPENNSEANGKLEINSEGDEPTQSSAAWEDVQLEQIDSVEDQVDTRIYYVRNYKPANSTETRYGFMVAMGVDSLDYLKSGSGFYITINGITKKFIHPDGVVWSSLTITFPTKTEHITPDQFGADCKYIMNYTIYFTDEELAELKDMNVLVQGFLTTFDGVEKRTRTSNCGKLGLSS